MAEIVVNDIGVEYAKTGRASCRVCKVKIDQGRLRLARYTQSPHFDGLQPNWHHAACFWTKKHLHRNIAAPEDIHGYTTLRPDDQESIAADFAKAKNGAPGAPSDSKKSRGEGVTAGLQTELAKSNQSRCRVCEEIIVLATPRIAFDYLGDNAFVVPAWHHPKCFFENHMDKLTSLDDIDGFERLFAIDGAIFQALFEGKEAPERVLTEADLAASVVKKSRKIKKKLKVELDELLDDQANFEALDMSASEKKRERSVNEVEVLKKSASSSRAARARARSISLEIETVDVKKVKREAKKKNGKGEGKRELVGNETQIPVEEPRVKKETYSVSKSECCPSTSAPQAVPLAPAVQALRDQTRALWKVKDSLFSIVRNMGARTKKELYQTFLTENGIFFSGTENALFEIVVDVLTFGVAQMCPACNKSHLIPREDGYTCPVHQDWASCAFFTDQPVFSSFSVSGGPLTSLLGSFLFALRDKVLVKRGHRAKVMTKFEMDAQLAGKKTGKPFKNVVIALAGKLSRSHASLSDLIKEYGGELATTIGANVAVLVTTRSDFEQPKRPSKIDAAINFEINVVNESWIHDCILYRQRLGFSKDEYLLHAGKTNINMKRPGERLEEDSRRKIIIKGGAAVDSESDKMDTHHVYRHDGTLYAAVLAKSDVKTGSNSYYRLQVLESDDRKNYCVFRAWGRVGTTVGKKTVDEFDDADDAIKLFKKLYADKTSNLFGEPFVKKPLKMYPLDIDVGQDILQENQAEPKVLSGSKTTLEKPVQDLLTAIFDVNAFRETMIEMELDLSKMPLGKISKAQIKVAYEILSSALKELSSESAAKTSNLDRFSNMFFTLIPHDFGLRKPTVLNTEDIIKSKLGMLDTLLEIEIATMIIKNEITNDEEDPMDVHYRALKTEIKVLDKTSPEFKLIEQAVKTTHAPTHVEYQLIVEDVFVVSRQGEDQLKDATITAIGNRKLLWHGSRVANYVGILSQGLRIAPPEAPTSGYMFGKGIYLSDMVTKSANYCMASHARPTGLLLLGEVALGEMHELTQSDFIEKLPAGKSSTKGCGATGPRQFVPFTTGPDIELPIGPPLKQKLPGKKRRADLLYNEYIVYNPNQVILRYLVKTKFEFQKTRTRNA